MIDKNTARNIALAEIDKPNPYQREVVDLVLLDQYTLEKEYGWVFFYQSRLYVETDDFGHALAGNSPFLVQKEDGQIFRFSTAHPVEWYLAGYKAGFRLDSGTLTVLRVFNLNKTLSCLVDLRMFYVIPEFACGVEWRIPQCFSLKQIKLALRTLPAVFENVRIMTNHETFLEMNASACCDYRIEPSEVEA